MRIHWLSALILAATSLMACSPQVARYRYLELTPDPALDVLATGRPALEGLLGAGSIPLRYALSRDAYVLHLEVPAGSYLPALRLSLLPDTLRLRPTDAAQRGCANWYQDSPDGSAWRFGWPPDCEAGETAAIRFEVLAPDGRVLGSEALGFSLRSAGWYYRLDAI